VRRGAVIVVAKKEAVVVDTTGMVFIVVSKCLKCVGHKEE
jgi:hypothetical protein